MSFDRSNNAHDVQILGSPTLRGTKEIDLSSTGMFLNIPDHADFSFAGDFTVEVFGVKFASTAATKTIISHGGGSPNWSWYLIKQTNGSTGINWSFSFNGTAINGISGPLTVVAGTPYDFCVERSGTTLRIYIDGTMVVSDTSNGAYHNTTEDLVISRLTPGSSFGEGLIKLTATRITNGVARYNSDGGYTVPTLPLPTQ